MTRLFGRAGTVAVLCALIVAPSAYGVGPMGAGPTPLRTLPSQNVLTPNRSATNPALTEYMCPSQIKVSWSHGVIGAVGGGWTDVGMPLGPQTVDYVFSGFINLYLGQMYCGYVPTWLKGKATPNGIFFDFDVQLRQPVGPGTCYVRPDHKGFGCRQ